MSQVSLNYLLRKEGIDSVVIGARNKKQLLENIGSSDWELTHEEVFKLDEVSKSAKNYPAWYYDIFRKDRMEKTNYFIKNHNNIIIE
jgi:diketogulonate reductase-like aldo/keto reductase